ncbi:MAG: hypothetical protein OEV40_13870, partial [Acidimicrobiia bacterium]|nr:hypothetical protein [Acidimicrobiia bacterium]
MHAILALDDLESQRRPPDPTSDPGGLRVAQLTLAGELDGHLSRGGRGDTGGVASLIVSLGEALVEHDDVSQVLTIGRGSLTDALTDQLTAVDDRLHYASLPIGDTDRPASTSTEMWEHVPAIERGLRRVLGKSSAIDVLHLRMADAGTLAASNVAAGLGIDVCFSLAPDPHSVIQTMQSRGELDRTSFSTKDYQEHLWFRARFVEHLARTASRLALFPQRNAEGFFDLSISGGDNSRRAVVVPEGIAVASIRRAEAELDQPQPTSMPPDGDVLADLA